MPKLWRLSFALAALTFPLPATAFAEGLKVVASFSIIGDFAKNVGGDRIELTTLVGPDGDAHAYEPKPTDAAAMAGARVVLVNGLHLEGFLHRLIETSGSEATVAELAKGVETVALEGRQGAHAEDEEDGHHAGDIDPHAFQSAANAEIYVRNIADAFCAADSGGCDAYRANAEAYAARLRTLDAEIKATVAAIPAGKRTIITSHDAFGYFEHAYGLRFLAPEAISTEAEASAADVAALIRQVRTEKASAIFLENITNPRLMEQVAAETGIAVGGTLYSDALSQPEGPAATYLELMRHNIATIKGAILGS